MLPSASHLNPITPQSHPWTRRWLGTRAYWIAQAAGWGGFLLLSLQELLRSPKNNTYETMLESACVIILGIVTTHTCRILLLLCRRRTHSWRGMVARVLPVWLLAGFALGGSISMVSVCWLHTAELEAGTLVQGSGWGDYLSMVTQSLVFSGIWFALYFEYHYYSQYRESVEAHLRLEAEVREAEVRALKAQMHPHFLFNSLNTIRAMIPRDLPAPRRAITSLAELLRAGLRLGDVRLVTLADELEIVENYLTLEQTRHEGRLRVRRLIASAALTHLVPPFSVQNLVQNAVNHGIAPRVEGGEVAIEARVIDGMLEVLVRNPGNVGRGAVSTGLGLRNVRAQIALLYGATAQLELMQEAADLVATRLVIPPLSTRESAA